MITETHYIDGNKDILVNALAKIGAKIDDKNKIIFKDIDRNAYEAYIDNNSTLIINTNALSNTGIKIVRQLVKHLPDGTLVESESTTSCEDGLDYRGFIQKGELGPNET